MLYNPAGIATELKPSTLPKAVHIHTQAPKALERFRYDDHWNSLLSNGNEYVKDKSQLFVGVTKQGEHAGVYI